MRFIDSRSIGAISSVVGTPSVVTGSGIFSLLFGVKKAKGMSKAQRKKLSRRRYRRFVDNIVMHHKRLHDRNREITINLAKSRTLSKINKKKKSKSKSKSKSDLSKSPKLMWQDRFPSNKDRASNMRDRVGARRIRAKSRWLTTILETHDQYSKPTDYEESSFPA